MSRERLLEQGGPRARKAEQEDMRSRPAGRRAFPPPAPGGGIGRGEPGMQTPYPGDLAFAAGGALGEIAPQQGLAAREGGERLVESAETVQGIAGHELGLGALV